MICSIVNRGPSSASIQQYRYDHYQEGTAFHFIGQVWLILLYGCTTRTLTKRLEKKLDSNYTRMLRAILNKSWQQHPTRHQLYGHLPPITKTIQARWTRHAGHCWRSRDELISDVLLWIPTYGWAKAGRPVQIYIQQLCEDIGYSPDDLPEAMNDREKWRERVRDIRACGTTWWWWWNRGSGRTECAFGFVCFGGEGEQMKLLIHFNSIIYMDICVDQTSLPRAQSKTRSIFKNRTASLNSEFLSSLPSGHTKAKKPTVYW